MCLTRGLSYSARGFFRLWIYGVDKFEILLFNGIPNRPYKPYYSEISTDTLSPPIMTNRLSVKVSVSKKSYKEPSMILVKFQIWEFHHEIFTDQSKSLGPVDRPSLGPFLSISQWLNKKVFQGQVWNQSSESPYTVFDQQRWYMTSNQPKTNPPMTKPKIELNKNGHSRNSAQNRPLLNDSDVILKEKWSISA